MMGRRLYTLIWYVLLPLVFVRLLWRSRKAPDYARRWPERLGWFAAPRQTGGIWLHTVSVGETIAAAPLVRQLRDRYSQLPMTITTMTPTGSERVKALFGDSVFHVYIPYDVPAALNRFLNRVQPQLALVMETELWPNMIDCCARHRVPVLIANARLSARSARGYRRFAGLTASMLTQLTHVIAQTDEDAARFQSLGLVAPALSVSGNIKFDIEVPVQLEQQGRALRREWQVLDEESSKEESSEEKGAKQESSKRQQRPVWIAASTHQGEDELILDALADIQSECPELLLVLVPRHPERFNSVASLCQQRGLSVSRRSSAEPVTSTTQVMLADTMGELLQLYAASDIAFVGGSLVDTGGHNYLEPAALGLPLISGPSYFNFKEVAEQLLQAQALTLVENQRELVKVVRQLVGDSALSRRQGDAAMHVVANNRGALGRLLAVLDDYLVFAKD